VAKDKQVSVVCACYNMGKYLPEAIRSVLDQRHENIELLIVDDGSIDDTRAAVKPFLADDRVRYFHQSNRGQAKAKNKGLRESSGDFIAFIDADDLWTPDKLEKQLPCFDRSPAIGVVYTNVTRMDEHGVIIPTPKMNYYSGRISGRLLVDNFVTGMASMIKRECLDRVGLFDESFPMGIDYDLWLRISAHYEFYYLDEITYLYRQWPGQMSHNYRKRMDCAIRIMNKFLSQYPGLVDQGTVSEAWAHTYTTSANGIGLVEKKVPEALKEYAKALRWKASYLPAWKGLARLMLASLSRGKAAS
jgi:glycosyltransferase involved in cell wall biosynthesis